MYPKKVVPLYQSKGGGSPLLPLKTIVYDRKEPF